MNKFAICAAALAVAVGGASQANATDWKGFYFGVNAGYAHSSADSLAKMGPGGYFNGTNLASINANGGVGLDASGGTAGVGVGYNTPLGSWLVGGIEADVNYFDGGESRSQTIAYPLSVPAASYTTTARIDQNLIATVRARVGFQASANGLLYLTGGYAYSDAEYGISFKDNYPGGVPAAIEQTSGASASGWTAGAGGEFMVGANTSLKVEYLYYDFGSLSASGSIGGGGASHTYSGDLDLTAETYRIGVNFHF